MFKNLIPLQLPEPDLKLARKGEDIMVWDDIRKKYLKLTPEEWVRQHYVHLLLENDFPKSTITLEGGFRLHQKLQRTDILIYKDGKPAMLVECKAPQIPINQKTLDQASRYNLHYKAPVIVLTNGLETYIAKVDFDKEQYSLIDKIPPFNEL